MSQARETEDGFTKVTCPWCGKSFRFLNASPDYVESIAFCGNRCRELYFWFKGKAQFERLFEGEGKEEKKVLKDA